MLQGVDLLRKKRVPGRLIREILVLPANQNPTVRGAAQIEVRVRRLPNQLAIAPKRVRLRGRGKRPRACAPMSDGRYAVGQLVAGGEHQRLGFELNALRG